eukprot:1309283-Amphidinium_carterae.1
MKRNHAMPSIYFEPSVCLQANVILSRLQPPNSLLPDSHRITTGDMVFVRTTAPFPYMKSVHMPNAGLLLLQAGPGTPEDLIFFYAHLHMGGTLAKAPARSK